MWNPQEEKDGMQREKESSGFDLRLEVLVIDETIFGLRGERECYREMNEVCK